jgi:hypothetical protein
VGSVAREFSSGEKATATGVRRERKRGLRGDCAVELLVYVAVSVCWLVVGSWWFVAGVKERLKKSNGEVIEMVQDINLSLLVGRLSVVVAVVVVERKQ